MTTTAETAKLVRATLKAAYPAVIFSVKSRSFAGGDDVNVDWTDGPTTEAVNALIKEYEGGTFDGMQDLYEYRNDSPKHPTAKYVFGNRHFSKEAYATHRAVVCAKYDIPTDTDDDQTVIQIGGHAYLGQLVTHELHQMDLTS